MICKWNHSYSKINADELLPSTLKNVLYQILALLRHLDMLLNNADLPSNNEQSFHDCQSDTDLLFLYLWVFFNFQY